MKLKVFILFLIISSKVFSQGYNHQWLLGYGNWASKGRISFDTSSYSFLIESRKMGFEGTEATICDQNGNFLMSSNGVWIANANNDTMMNGGGLNPGYYVNTWPDGLLINYGNVFLPFPEDTNKFILFHQTRSSPNYPSELLYYSVIDITLSGGFGGIINKNDTAFLDTLSWGIAACRHANGRDWWIVAFKDSSDIIYKLLFTPDGITSVSTQKLNFTPFPPGNSSQLTFSKDGLKLAYTTYDNIQSQNCSVLVFDFDRCTGNFFNAKIIQITSGTYIWGLAFSSSGKFIYACSSTNIFQITTDSLTVASVAVYDGFYSPYTFCCATTFWNLYLAANGKIYGTTGNGTQHIHEINYPDSVGIYCDVQQHAINLGMWNFRAVPNHPNYYLGPIIGSICDSLTGMDEHLSEVQNFAIKPNPNNSNFNISYLLPQTTTGGKSSWFEVFDVMGKQVFKMPLPPWSTLQSIQLPNLSDGVYYAVIKSGYERASKKIVVIKD